MRPRFEIPCGRVYVCMYVCMFFFVFRLFDFSRFVSIHPFPLFFFFSHTYIHIYTPN
ncbi:hypothetical protein GGS20DRAFT_556659, partial [Poronia punctata]